MSRAWVAQAVQLIESDFQRSADTHMIKVDLPRCASVDLYLKDESTHPTGSLKHRLARSLFLYGLCNGWITEGKPLIEASSGSTAVSEAYFARLIGVPFTAVMPRSTSRAKIEQIAHYGGECHFVDDPGAVYAEAERLAESHHGHYLDQFTYAERATDWRGNNNIAESIFRQLEREQHPVPAWIVVGAGTGGTSATIGRYLRYTGVSTQLCVVDPENSVFADHFHGRPMDRFIGGGSGIEGIGRPRVEPSFVPEVIERMIQVPNAASLAAMRYLERLLGRRYGGSTGTNVYGALQLITEMEAAGQSGSVVTLACDPGDRYLDTYYDDDWVAAQGYDLGQHFLRE